MKVVRNHDKLYLHESRKSQPKEYFKFIATKAANHLASYQQPSVLDIGCATGDFLFFMKSLYSTAQFTGLDIMPELLYKARNEVSGCTFLEGNICQKSSLPNNTFDAVFMNGVHSIFDDFYPWLDHVLELTNTARGRAYIFGIWNSEDVDVLVKARYSGESMDSPWQAGWNCFSMKSCQKYLAKLHVKSAVFYDFKIEIDIPRNTEDPLRSWTFFYKDGTRGIINGTMLLHDFKLLEIVV